MNRKALWVMAVLFVVSSMVLTACGAGGGGGATAASNAGGVTTWVDVTGTSIQAVPNTGYLADNASQVTITLPASLAFGDIIQVTGVGTGGWKIAQNAGQSIATQDIEAIAGTWTPRDSARFWQGVASSSDGTKLVAAENGGQIYTSINTNAFTIVTGDVSQILKSPLIPLFQRGRSFYSPLWKRGARGDLT